MKQLFTGFDIATFPICCKFLALNCIASAPLKTSVYKYRNTVFIFIICYAHYTELTKIYAFYFREVIDLHREFATP